MRDRAKKNLFCLAMLSSAWLVVESVASLAHYLVNGTFFSPRAVRNAIEAQLLAPGAGASAAGLPASVDPYWSGIVEVIHPYAGFVPDPYMNKGLTLSEFGFLDGGQRTPSFPKRSTDRTIVGVGGGSFAVGIFLAGGPLLNDCLTSVTGKPVVLLNLAQGGYKQPQQSLMLAYLFSIGAELDIVINIDGFNDIALPLSDNVIHGTNPYYPRVWHDRTRNLPDYGKLKQVGYMEWLRERRRGWAAFFAKYRLYWSPTGCLIWQPGDLLLSRAIERARSSLVPAPRLLRFTAGSLAAFSDAGRIPGGLAQALAPLHNVMFTSESQLLDAVERHVGAARTKQYDWQLLLAARSNGGGASDYVAHGPQYRYEGDERLYSDLADVWKRSSLHMKAVSNANAARYFHFLQPNQYVRGTKPMTEKEKAVALVQNHPYGTSARKGYRFLRAAGRELSALGVDFVDLTMIYAGNSAVVYADNCCHANEDGYAIVANRVCEVIRSRSGDRSKVTGRTLEND